MNKSSEITITKLNKDYNSCNCCRDKNLNMYEIKFLYSMGKFGSQGITLMLCEKCIEELKNKLEGVIK